MVGCVVRVSVDFEDDPAAIERQHPEVHIRLKKRILPALPHRLVVPQQSHLGKKRRQKLDRFREEPVVGTEEIALRW